MKNWKRILGLGMTAALLTGVLAGCAPAGGEKETESPTTTATPSAPAEGQPPLVATEDAVMKTLGIPADTVMLTVDGESVTAEQFCYWLGYTIDNFGYYYFQGAENIDWEQESEGLTVGDAILSEAKETAVFYSLIESKVNEENIVLTDAEREEMNTQIAANIEQYGEEDYAKQLQQMSFSDAGFRHLMEVSLRYRSMQQSLFGENGTMKPTAEELVAIAEKSDLLAAKHILISTLDNEGQALAGAEAADAKAQAEDILAQLRAVSGKEQVELFDTLMNEHSADGRDSGGNLMSANGYLFGAGEMVPEFEEGTKALEFGQISDLVETSYGYHIILRLTPDSPALLYTKENTTLGDYWVSSKLREMTDGWIAAAKVEDSAEMAKVDPKDFFEKLTAYRESLEPAPLETAPPSETATPSTTPAPTPEANG